MLSMPMRSLQLRIVAAIVLVCAVTLAAVALYIGRTTLLVHIGPPADRVTAAVSSALAPALRTVRSQRTIPSQLARLNVRYDARIVVISATLHRAFDASGPIAYGDMTTEPNGAVQLALRTPGTSQAKIIALRGGTPVVDEGKRTLWRLFVVPTASALDVLASVRGSIIDSIWKSAALGLVAALAVAIALGSYIVKPIRELTLAAQGVSAGDTTRRVKVGERDEIGRLAQAFNVMADSIEATERLRRLMITDVAHELRSPLTRMIAELEAAADGHISREEGLAGAREDAQRLERIVNDLRDLSLADAHELSIPRHAVSVSDCIDDAISRAKQEAAKAHVSLARDVAPDLPTALADELRMAQILDNLLSNALHYTPAGGHVVVGARPRAGCIECFVQDSGAGIAQEHAQQVFERFYRADPSRSRSTGGSGLGLAIVKSLVEALGGTIGVDSVLGHGSRFTWTLPTSGA